MRTEQPEHGFLRPCRGASIASGFAPSLPLNTARLGGGRVLAMMEMCPFRIPVIVPQAGPAYLAAF